MNLLDLQQKVHFSAYAKLGSEFTKITRNMTILSARLCQECRDVENILEIDIKRLLKDLAEKKGRKEGGKELTEQEKKYICLSFLGNDPIDIARIENSQRLYVQIRRENPSLTEEEIHILVEQKLRDRARDISNFLSNTVNQYILNLITNFDDSISERVPRPSWLKILRCLLANGYKKGAVFSEQPSSRKTIVINSEDEILLKKMVELVKMVNQKFGNGSLTIEYIESEGDENNE